MTIQDVLTLVDELKPNQYEEETLIRWISEAEALIYQEYVKWHEGAEELKREPYDPLTDIDAELLVPDAYAQLYIHYLCAQIDYFNGDMARYQNSMIRYNTALSAYADWFNRENKPVSPDLKVYGD